MSAAAATTTTAAAGANTARTRGLAAAMNYINVKIDVKIISKIMSK